MKWIGRPLNIQDRVPLNISARMDASRVLSLRIVRKGGGKYLWMWISYHQVRYGVQRILTYDNPTRKLVEIVLIVKGPKLVVIFQFWLLVDWYRRYCFEKALIVDDEDRRYLETVGLYYDTISKKAISTSKMVVQQESPGYPHLQPSLLPHLVLLLPLLKLCHREQVLPIRRNRIG